MPKTRRHKKRAHDSRLDATTQSGSLNTVGSLSQANNTAQPSNTPATSLNPGATANSTIISVPLSLDAPASNANRDVSTADHSNISQPEESDHADDEADNEAIAGVSLKKRIHPSSKNPIHGVVEGVKRGNEIYRIIRTNALPKPVKDRPSAGKRFTRLMKDLVVRCERASLETGCWLYIAGQHATANLGFIHYGSPRLRREGKDQLIPIQNSFNAMFTSLLEARRHEAVQLSLQKQELENTLESTREAHATVLSEKDAEIARLAAQLEVFNNAS